MKLDFRYCGRNRIDFLPASYWEGWVEASVWSGEEDGTLVWDRDVDEQLCWRVAERTVRRVAR